MYLFIKGRESCPEKGQVTWIMLSTYLVHVEERPHLFNRTLEKELVSVTETRDSQITVK